MCERTKWAVFWAALLWTTALALWAKPSCAASDATGWEGWGNGLRFDHFSPADQINAANVSQLRPVWKYVIAQKGNWEITPIVVGGVLYIQDMQGNAIALDPETGRALWHFSTGIRAKMRALSYWRGDQSHGPRLIMGANDRIYEIDPRTGKMITSFGAGHGYIDVRDGFAKPGDRYAISSPPTVYRNLLITGPSTQEFGSKGPPGDPRAYDVITGKLVWRFHTVPRPGERNFGSWGEGWKDRAGPSAWSAMSVDEETGLVFVCTGNPADSYIGIDRPGDNLYANSVIALDALTGKYRWHFQMVHHDLFDYDISSPASLVDLTVKGRPVKALVVLAKNGLMFIFDRRTGKPVFGVDERAVPASTIPGEEASATQPFPRKPVALAKMGVTRADITTITPESNRFCTDEWNRLGLIDTPPYLPPRLNGPNLYMPSNIGGAGGVWGGVSIDPLSGYVFVNTSNVPAYSYIVRADASDKISASGYKVERAYTKFLDQNGFPCIQPPWGELIAVNANTGEIAWRRPLGSAEKYGDVGAHTGMITMGGSLATAGELVFIGATSAGYSGAVVEQPEFRAFDSKTGQELWNVRLSSAAESSPMSYVGESGRQYVVVAESGSPRANAETALVAFALPRPGDPQIDLKPAPIDLLQNGLEPASAPMMKTSLGPADLPIGSGRDDVLRVCGSCHSLSTALGADHTSSAWTDIIEEMRSRGAQMDGPTALRIRDYLALHFAS